MAIYKRLLCLLTAVALLLAVPIPARAAEDFPTILAEAKKGVVQVYGLGNDGTNIYSWVGSGFAVGEEGEDSDVFLTNWHVVTGSGDFDLSQVQIWILQENCQIDSRTGEPEASRSITCEVLKTTSGHPDYAIIQATEPVSGYKALPLLSSDEVQDGATVYALGFPAVVGEASASHYGIDDITSTDGIVSQHMQYALEGDTWVLMHTATISGGNSGGPLITEKGAVVGLNTYGFGDSDSGMNRYCAVYIDYAMDGLDELGIDYDVFGESAESLIETVLDSPMLLAAVLGGVAILVVGVVVFVLLQQKKAREQAAAEARRRQEEERRRIEEARRQQEAERQRQEEEARQRKLMEPKAMIRLNGRTTYPIPASGATIGRDPGCSIVLPENAPGVSRRHCRLDFYRDQLVLIDTNSSHGTIIHGKRVPANVKIALSQGSSFSLGSEKYTFTVC